MAKTHGVTPGTPVTPESARHVARVMGALATASRTTHSQPHVHQAGLEDAHDHE